VLNTAPFRLLIRQAGRNFEWLKATPCSCYDPRENYDQQPGCPSCEHGYVYRSQGIKRGLIAPRKTHILHPDLGWVPVVETTLTTLPDEAAFGRFDKVVLVDQIARERVRVSRTTDRITVGRLRKVVQLSDNDTIYSPRTDYQVDLATGQVTWLTTGPEKVYAADVEFVPIMWYIGQDGQLEVPAMPGHQTPITGTLSQTPPSA